MAYQQKTVEELREFMARANPGEQWRLPANRSVRKSLHQECDKIGLLHESEWIYPNGENRAPVRVLVITKPNIRRLKRPREEVDVVLFQK